MFSCPVCSSLTVKKNGIIEKTVMQKSGKKVKRIQLYKCSSGHKFRLTSPAAFDDSFIEYTVYLYLRCLSFNTTVDIIRATYEEDILSKGQVLDFLECVADALPTIDDVDLVLAPVRSGFLAMDGVWFSYNDTQIVLLVCFDPVTFDIIHAFWTEQETQSSYTKLLTSVLKKIPKEKIRGVYGDGDLGLIHALKEQLPDVPFQMCVVHKEMRMGILVPVKRVNISKKLSDETKTAIKTFQQLFRNCIYADSKEEAKAALPKLKTFAQESGQDRFLRAYRSLAYNFQYTLTHFDHPHMERDNNLIECFNGILKPRLSLMKSFKKQKNLDRYLKLFLLEFRFRVLKESRFKTRRGQCPLEIGEVYLPKYYNFITFLREKFNLRFSPLST